MKPTEKKKNANQSVFAEIFQGIVGLFLGDASSRIGFVILLLIGGILFLTLPVADMDGTNVRKDTSLSVMGLISLVLSVILIISWIRKRKRK